MDFTIFKAIMVIMTAGYQQGGVDTLPFATLEQCQKNMPIVEQAVDKRTTLFANTQVFCIELNP